MTLVLTSHPALKSVSCHLQKVSKCGVYSGPYFPHFGNLLKDIGRIDIGYWYHMYLQKTIMWFMVMLKFR